MPAVNVLARVSGAASLHYKGQDFWTKDVAAFDLDFKPFQVKSDAFGSISNRAASRIVTVTFTPVGVWTAAQIAVLFPWLNPRLGDLNTPIRTISAVDTGGSNFTSDGHGQITGTGVRVGTVGVGALLPTGLAPNTTYYLWCNADGNTVQFYDTEAHALAADGVTGTGQILVTSVGAGTIRFVVNSPLIITTVDGVMLTVWNAAIVEQPSLSIGPTNSVFKQVKIEGYTLHGQLWSDPNSIYNYGAGAITALPPNQAQIPSVSYTIDWGTALPASALSTGAKTFTIDNHGLATGQAVAVEAESANGVLPTGIVANTVYYVIVVDLNTIQLADTQAHALAGTNQIVFTDVGVGTISILSVVQALGLSPREQVEIDNKVTWSDVMSGGNGIDARRIKEATATVSFVPTNLDYQTILNALALQGGTAAPGQTLPTANLDVYGPGETPFVRVYGASPQNSPARFGTDADRVDKLTFISNSRSFRGPVANPVAYVGVAAPAN